MGEVTTPPIHGTKFIAWWDYANDETDSEAEAASHVFRGSSCFDDGGEGLCLVGRVHCESLEVLGKAGFAHFAFLAFDDEAGDFVVFG